MPKITIPPAALEAGRKAFTEAMLTVPQPDPIRAAFEAMIGAWPLMCHVPATPSGKWTQNASLAEHLILPLTEASDD